MAQPERALDMPALPDLKPVSALGVPSSKEENEAYLKNPEEWRSVAVYDSERVRKEKEANTAFQIRYAPLPDRRVEAIPDKRISTPVTSRQANAEKTTKTAASKQTKEEEAATTEACKALADQRRKQLEAMEIDRKTLAALKAALSDLKLTDKLSFMAKDGSGLFPVDSVAARTEMPKAAASKSP